MEIKSLEELPKEEYLNILRQTIKLAAKERENLNIKKWKPFLKSLILQNTYVAIDNGKVVGFVNFGYNPFQLSHLPYIRAVAVDKKYRRRGLGKKLLSIALEKLDRPVWMLINDDNKAMQQFAIKAGFVPWIKKLGQHAYIKTD